MTTTCTAASVAPSGRRRSPLHDVVVAGVHNTKQARRLPDTTSASITLEAIRGVLRDTGLTLDDVDGLSLAPFTAEEFAHSANMRPVWTSTIRIGGVSAILEAAAAIACGQATTVLIATGQAGVYVDRESTAPWTRPTNQFVEPWGLFTAAHFAQIARQHMARFGTTREQISLVAATIRNNGHRNPEAIYYGRGPFTIEDIVASRKIAEPYHLLDCASTSEGASAVILTTAERARDLPQEPIYLLGGAREQRCQMYVNPAELEELGTLGEVAGRKAFDMAECTPADVDLCELYDNFSWELIRTFEALGFCKVGEGGPYVETGVIGPEGRHPLNTDGGLMSFSHCGGAQRHQRVVEAVKQLRGQAGVNQVRDPSIALVTNGGSAGGYFDVLLLGTQLP